MRVCATGYSNFKQLVFVLLPILVGAFSVAVAINRRNKFAWHDKWILRIGLHSQLRVQGVLSLALIGVVLVVLNLSVPSIYQCVEPLTSTTIVPVEADTAFQWSWAILGCLGNLVCGTICRNTRENDSQKAARTTQRWLQVLNSRMVGSCTPRQALFAWRTKSLSEHAEPTAVRTLLFYILHVPIILLAMIPACGYVTAQESAKLSLMRLVVGARLKCSFW